MASESPKVSIITPTFNRAVFIVESLKSVLAQTMPDWELLIVDDGSTDTTRVVLEPFLANPRIHYFYQPNQGQSIARNNALEKARGAFIGFLDSDDLWCTDKLERQLALFENHPDVDIVHGDESMIDEQGQEISRENMRRYSGRITPQLLADNSVSITTAMVRRECFDEMGGFLASHGVADDYDLWLRFSARYRFHYEPGIVAAYRVMPDQISSDKRRRFAANEKIIKDFLYQYDSALSPQERRWGLARFYCRSARYFASVGDRGKAARKVLKALWNAPLDLVVWRAVYRVLVPQR
jgi:glycosyltransferase involved in cell wall biosynthesis